MDGKLSFEEAVFCAGITPDSHEEVVTEFFKKNLLTHEECEKVWKKARELKAKNPNYFEDLD